MDRSNVRGVPASAEDSTPPAAAGSLPGSPARRLVLYAGVGALGRAATVAMPSAIVLAVIGAGESPADGSLLVASVSAVGAIVGPVVGAFIDRMGRPRQGFLFGLVVLAVGSMVLAFGIGTWPIGLLLVVSGLTGLAQPVMVGAWSGQLRRIVPDMPAARVYAVDVGTYNVAEVTGPALVGAAFVIDASFPGAISLEVVALIFMLAAVILPFVPIPARSETTSSPPEAMGRTLRHVRVMVRSLSLRRNTIIGTISFAAIAFIIIATPLLGEELGGDAGVGVFLLTVIAIGALLGTAVLARRPTAWRGPGTVALGATVILGILLVAMSFSPAFWVAAVFALLFGMVQASQLTSIFRVRDREAPTEARGMVFVASASLRTGAFAVGSVIAGALTFAGWRWMLVAAAGVEFLSVVVALLSAPRRRGVTGGTRA